MTAHDPSAASIITMPQVSETTKQHNGDLWVALIFALKTFAAALLALFFAFWLGLDEPRWAILTVYVVSQPESGLVLAKSFYRILGTAAGLLVTTLFVFTFSQYGVLFLALLAVWTGICNFAARAERNFTSYGFILAGYTAAIVGIPAALNPTGAYPLVVARSTEILLGICCAALVSRLVAPQELTQKLLILVRQLIVRVSRFAAAATESSADKAVLASERNKLIQDLASVEAMRASAYFESAEARRLNGTIRQVTVAALTVCAVVEDAASRSAAACHPSNASRWIMPALSSKTNDSPIQNADVVSKAVCVSDQRAILNANIELGKAEIALECKPQRWTATIQLQTWSDPVPAVLTGIRTTIAVALTSAIWFATAWPTGFIAVIVAVCACGLFAAMERPATISVALAATILIAIAPVFVTVFYLLPLASNFISMALALAPLMLICGFIMAEPRIGAMGQMTAVYFTVGSKIDNVMPYDTAEFLNTSLAILFGLGTAWLLFATVFPETPAQALRRLRRQLLFQLGRFSKSRDYTFASYAYGLCDQVATTFTRVKDEPLIARQCYDIAMTALSTGYAIDRLKKTLATVRIGTCVTCVTREIDTLLSRVTESFINPTRAGLTKTAWEARALRCRSLEQARASNDVHEVKALGDLLVGCEMLRCDLLKARILLPEASNAR
ncbi:MAG TPA: FUSC family protein [Terriglobales bacterium]|nr:FUSC family protein [Terriglobales bacterium]